MRYRMRLVSGLLGTFLVAVTAATGPAVAAGSATDVWATSGNDLFRWDGSIWAHAAHVGGGVDGISFDSPSDGWVVGYVAVGETTKPFAAHWDGLRWTPIQVPYTGDSVLLNDVIAISAADAWAVGVG